MENVQNRKNFNAKAPRRREVKMQNFFPASWRLGVLALSCLLIAALLAGCGGNESILPELPDVSSVLPDLSKLPGIPDSLRDLPGLLNELGLPDLSSVANLPGLENLPTLQAPPGALALNGPTERGIGVGERVPGTDIVLTGITADGAEFQIAGLRAVRAQGDSLDFDGSWPGLADVTYNLRLRIYYVGNNSVRAAGVHRLVIPNIQPVGDGATPSGDIVKFPFTASVNKGGNIIGTTVGYAGENERGGEITGLPAGDYPYRKIGDSITWTGHLCGDIVAQYSVRMLYYSGDQAQVGGVVTLALPGQ